jgi:hypothetical protein
VNALSDREEDVLTHLARLHFLTARQVEAFLYGSSALTSRSKTVMTQRLIYALKRRGLVAMRARTIGGPDFGEGRPTYHLTADGLRKSRPLLPGMPTHRRQSLGPSLARHALATAEVILAFRRTAQAQPDHELVGWECDWQAAFPLGSSILEPDAYLLYRAEERRLHAVVEVDMGTEHSGFVARKMRRYLELHRSGGWRARLPVWPAIVVVTPSQARLVQLRRLAQAVALLPGGQSDAGASFTFASIDELTGEPGPLGPIWQRLKGGRDLLFSKPGANDDNVMTSEFDPHHSLVHSRMPAAPSEVEETDGSNLTNQTRHGA